ncbi:E3 SUMO-protein ligase RanBP2-like isoform X2 [Lycorma delicatula]|uniref:E3 SUMO-protein ligase RanBP2-like isoform X2 n=1 Tax=Lycorma delicatula TaxID=130591 RepID=UPI003F517E57
MLKIILRERSKRDVDRYVDEIMRKVKNEKERNLRCYHIATQYFKVGDYASARRYVCMYLSAKEDSPMAHKLLGQIFEGLGEKEKAVSEYKRSLELENKQPELVLKICQLINESEVHFDLERARYWCERGEEMFPHDPAIFRLKERLLISNKENGVYNVKAFEDLIRSELRALPQDVGVRIRLLKLYVDTGRTEIAYNHVIELENLQIFRHDLAWYEYICELFQIYYDEFKSRVKADWEFYVNWLSALERLVALTLAETPGSVPRTLTDCCNGLFKFDKTLHQAHMISDTSRLFDEFLKHLSAQLCLHFATYIFKKAKKDQNNWKDASKSVQPLLLLSLTNRFDANAQFTVGLRDSQKKQVKLWNEIALYRVCQAGNVLLSLTKDSGPQFIEKVIHTCNVNWREKLFQRLFGQWDIKEVKLSSHFVQYTGYNTLPHHMIPVSQLRSPDYIKACEKVHPGSLHHIAWLGLQTMRHSSPRPPQLLPPPEFHTYGFPDLQFTVHNLASVGIESLNRLDLDSFLYATVLCAGAQLDDQIRSGFFAVNRPITLPADITAQFSTPEQAKWWNAIYKIYSKKAGNNWGDLRLVVQRGIEVVRAIGNHGLDVLLMIQLARTFAERAVSCTSTGKGSPGYSEIPALEARANIYWKGALPLLERMEKKQALRVPPTNRLFEFQGKDLEASQVTALLEEGRLFTACQLMKDEEYEAAIEAFKPLRSPYASFHSAAIYKRLAQAELSNCPGEEVTSEMRSKHIILLTKARESFNLTKDRIQNDKQHPLHHILGSHISDVESLLSRIELDSTPLEDRGEDILLSETSYSPPGSIMSPNESAGGDFNIGSITTHEMNGRHHLGHYSGNLMSSTPKSRHLRGTSHHHSHQQKVGLSTSDVEKMLVKQEGLILNKIETLLENHCRKIIEEVNIKMSTQLEAIDELRRDVTKLRTDDLYMLGDEEDYTEDMLGFPSAATYQPPPPNQTAPVPHTAVPPAFYPAPAPVARGAQGTSTVTYGAPQPQPAQFYPPQFQPSPQPPALQPHQLGFYSQGALPFSEGQQLPDFLRPGQGLVSKPPPVTIPPPVNVVITTSDTLPTGPPPVQPTLSVTIPPKHRMGSIQPQPHLQPQPQYHHVQPVPQPPVVNVPHEFQISMPPAAHIPDLQKQSAVIAALQDDLESDDGAAEVEHDPFPDFKPSIPLPDEIVVTTGEEGEKILFENRAKLFRFVDKEWKERGVGMLKILQNNLTGKVRLLMRREQVHKICANHYLTPDMILTPMIDSDRAWVWLAQDFADEKLQIEKLCAKFKTKDEATKFKEVFDSAKVMSVSAELHHRPRSSSHLNLSPQLLPNQPLQPFPLLPLQPVQLPQSSVKQPVQTSHSMPQKQFQLPQSIPKQPVQQPGPKIEVCGFTFTSEPVFKPPIQDINNENDKKETKNNNQSGPSPFASFTFGLSPSSNSGPKSAFLTTGTSPFTFTFNSTPTTVTESIVTGIFKASSPSSNSSVSFTPEGMSPRNSGSILKPPVLNPPFVAGTTSTVTSIPSAPAFVKAAPTISPEIKSVFQPTVFTSATTPLLTHQQSEINELSANRDILKTPIFTTPTGPNLILNQIASSSSNNNNEKAVTTSAVPVAVSITTAVSSTTQPQSKHVIFKENLESKQKSMSSSSPVKSNQQNTIGPKSILKETLAAEPLTVLSVTSSNANQKQYTKHVLFQETSEALSKDENIKSPQSPADSSDKQKDDKITLRRPHIPIEKFITSGSNVSNEKPSKTSSESDSPSSKVLFDKPSLIDFSTLAKSSDSYAFKTSDDFKGFEGAGTSVFKSVSLVKKTDQDGNNEDDGNDNEEFVPNLEFKPVIPLPELITVETGEEGQIVLYEQHAKLLRFDHPAKEWKERGVGKMKILHDPKTGSVRLLMRREQVFKVCCNHRLTSDLQLKLSFNSDRAWTWCAADYSEGVVTNEFFALRFKTTEQAIEFKNAVEKAKELLKKDPDLSLISDVSNEELSVTGSAESSALSSHTDTDLSNTSTNDDNEREQLSHSWINSLPLSQLNTFKRPEGSWECKFCLVVNDYASNACVSCSSSKPVIIKEITTSVTSSATTTTDANKKTTQPSLSELFKPKAGSWECSCCLVRNNPDVKKCPACGTMKEGEESSTSETVITGTSVFSPSFFSSDSGTTDFSKGGFSFGIPKQNTEGLSKSTYSFGNQTASTISASESNDIPSTGFKFSFGIPTTSTNTVVSSQTTTIASKPEDISTTFTKPIFGNSSNITPSKPTATFTFGGQNTSTPGKTFVFKGPDIESEENSENKFEFNFSVIRSPKPRSPGHPDTDGDSDGEAANDVDEESDSIFFQPVVPLPDKVPLMTGEENEKVLYSHRAKLFRFFDGEWKERGIGDVKVLKHLENKKIRLLMRRETILKLCLNHFLTPELVFQPKDDKTWLWCAMDYSEGEFSQEKFAIRFKTPDIAQDFKAAIDAAQVELSESSDDQSVSTPVSSTPEVSTAKDKESPAMKNFTFALPKLTGSPTVTSPSSTFSLAAQFRDNNNTTGDVPKSFGGSSETATDANGKDEGDVKVVYELNVSDELREAALKLQLPPNFYSYLNLPSCPGCEGCEREDVVTVETLPMTTSPSKTTVTTSAVSITSAVQNSVVASVISSALDTSITSDQVVSVTSTLDTSITTSDPKLISANTSDTSIYKTAASQPDEDKTCSYLFKDALSFADLSSKSSQISTLPEASENFRWSGANTTVFGNYINTCTSAAPKQTEGGGDSSGGEDEGEVSQSQNEPHFEPIVPLPPLIQVTTGEEEEVRVFCQRARLYQHHTDIKEWKERGVGEMKILHHPVKLTYRFLMRREQVHKVVCNHLITPELNLAPLTTSRLAWCWSAMNMAEEYSQPQLERLAVRFKNPELANAFGDKVNECIAHITKIKEEQAAAQLTEEKNVSKTDIDDDEDDDPEESSEYIDEEDDGYEIMFEKNVTLCVRNTSKDQWSTAGTGMLHILYCPKINSMSGQIRIIDDKDQAILSLTTIDANSSIEVQDHVAVWSAKDAALDVPKERQLMAKFINESDAESFLSTFNEVLCKSCLTQVQEPINHVK